MNWVGAGQWTRLTPVPAGAAAQGSWAAASRAPALWKGVGKPAHAGETASHIDRREQVYQPVPEPGTPPLWTMLAGWPGEQGGPSPVPPGPSPGSGSGRRGFPGWGDHLGSTPAGRCVLRTAAQVCSGTCSLAAPGSCVQCRTSGPGSADAMSAAPGPREELVLSPSRGQLLSHQHTHLAGGGVGDSCLLWPRL